MITFKEVNIGDLIVNYGFDMKEINWMAYCIKIYKTNRIMKIIGEYEPLWKDESQPLGESKLIKAK